MNELALFAGAGGGILGGKLLGWRTVCAVEIEPYAASVLIRRQNDGILDPFPIWDDICTFDGKPWRGIVDVVSGGFPCQDISSAGKGKGIENGSRSGLWVEMARIIDEVRPGYCYVENSPILTSRGLDRVLGDLATLGYNAEWGVLGAADVGAPHQRDRIWIVAYAYRQRREKQHIATESDKARQHTGGSFEVGGKNWWSIEPDVGRVADGVAARVDRLKAIGNGQVPSVAAKAFELLTNRLTWRSKLACIKTILPAS